MASQGSAVQADGPPHGDASSYPSMADRREIEKERVGRCGSLAWREREEDWRAELQYQKRQEGEGVL